MFAIHGARGLPAEAFPLLVEYNADLNYVQGEVRPSFILCAYSVASNSSQTRACEIPNSVTWWCALNSVLQFTQMTDFSGPFAVGGHSGSSRSPEEQLCRA